MIREICDEKFGEAAVVVDEGPLTSGAERLDGIVCIKRVVA